jgi:hypothetical protein
MMQAWCCPQPKGTRINVEKNCINFAIGVEFQPE